MRTIKFRGKTDSGKWCFGYFLHDGQRGRFVITDGLLEINRVNPDTVGQYTGLKDKNGKEIYEGDVLRSDKYPFSCTEDNDIDNYYGIIGWSDEAASFCMVSAQNPKSYILGMSDGISDSISQEKMQDFEVIGNVHDDEWKQYRAYIQDEDEEQHP